MSNHPQNIISLDCVNPGRSARITGYDEDSIPLKLLEMGLLPGNIVVVKRIAPLKDPIHITVSGYDLALRKNEASHILVELIHNQPAAV